MNEALRKKGLLRRYIIRKADKSPVDPKAEYFVLRLDMGAKDWSHVQACRKAILAYASAIAFHSPELAKDIYAKYANGFERFEPSGLDALREIIKEHEKSISIIYSGDESHRVRNILNHYQRKAAEGIAGKKEVFEKVASQILAFKMVAEMIGMGDTHAEKAARLRGFIQLLDNTLQKLREEQVENIESNWPYFDFGNRSEYPYREILRKFDQLKQENADLKKRFTVQETPQ
jgi:hypothetical protein